MRNVERLDRGCDAGLGVRSDLARSQASETPAANIFGILSRDVILQVDHRFEP
jgi:hypothetical protein